MFNSSKYTTWYNNIISSPDMCGENHHIIPKSLGGSDDPDNIVKLSLRKHFICHLLLTKMVDDSKSIHKMIHALKMMSKTRHITSRIYERLKLKLKEIKYTIIYNESTDTEQYLYYGESIPQGYIHGGRPKTKEWIESRKGIKQSDDHKRKRLSNLDFNKNKHRFYHKITGEIKMFVYPPDDNWIRNIKTTRSISDGRKGQYPWYDPITGKCKLFRENEPVPEGWLRGRNPDTRRTGWLQTDTQKQKAKEANQANYRVEYVDGSVETFTGLNDWFKRKNISKGSFGYRKNQNKLEEYFGIKKFEKLE